MPMLIILGVLAVILIVAAIIIFGFNRQTSEGSMYNQNIVRTQEEKNADIKKYEKIVKRSPRNVYANNELALLLSDTQPEKALNYINKAISVAPDKPLYRVNKALIITKNDGNPAAAVKSIDEAIKLAPQRSEYHHIKAKILEKSGQNEAAIKVYKKVVSLDDKNAEACYALANLLIPTDSRTAYSCITRAIDIDPKNPEYYYKKALILLDLDKKNMALEHFEKAVDLGCQEADAFYQLALLMVEKQPMMAMSNVNRALEIESDNNNYKILKADLHFDAGEFSDAEIIYKGISDVDLKNHYVKYKLACLNMDNPKVALDYIDKAIALSHSNASYFVLRGDLYRETNKDDAAREQYAKALRIDIQNSDAQYGMAMLMADTNPQSALAHINSALSLNSNNPHYRALKGRILGVTGDGKGALNEFVQLIESNPENHEAYYELALMFRKDNIGSAIENINRAVELNPSNLQYNMLKADLLHKSGNKDEAILVYKDIISTDVDNPVPYYKISRLLIDDEPEAAINYLDSAIKIEPNSDKYYALKAEYLSEHFKRNNEAIELYNKAISINPNVKDYYLRKSELLRMEGHLIAAYDAEDSAKKINRS